ncbi:O-antigen ligase-like membrane protein [Jatrophihabitans sp. GAS493]|uniref:O-antigen ligase family protein n=1 Tax=Jatrophihabitans sp. GAS493 TaxID=1907575 RepID=UPI000BB89108|nr:O-antigen ligase family protein [Jatrophihabitans sp. GAS493]SOD70296.1 O-antigen ligase-like membrane protein [Jatrophihabitans sp. GAS493]
MTDEPSHTEKGRASTPPAGDEEAAELDPDAIQKHSLNLRLLTLLLVFLLAIPARLIFKPIGAAGTPAEMTCVLLLGYWVFQRLSTPARHAPLEPIQRAMLLYMLAVLASYVAATTRPIAANELTGGDRALLTACSWLGVLFFASELVSRAELDILLRRTSFGVGCLSTLGVVQFVTGLPFTNYIVIPGLTLNSALTSVLERNGRNRPAGTATHPIEFGAVLTMVLPIALHYALYDTHRSKVKRWFPVVAIAIAIPISISRSAIVSAAVALIVLIPSWPKERRRRAYASIVGLLGVAYLFIPGLLGTLTGLFTGIGEDSSASSRTNSYAVAAHFIKTNPIFGRGQGTFLIGYHIFDNFYLGAAVETGVVGVAAILTLYLTAIITNRKLHNVARDESTRDLAQAFAASFAAAALSTALYDAYSFPMATTLLFFLLGCAAALRRRARAGDVGETALAPS